VAVWTNVGVVGQADGIGVDEPEAGKDWGKISSTGRGCRCGSERVNRFDPVGIRNELKF
jgi:hypothetical protein